MKKEQAIELIRKSGVPRYATAIVNHLMPSARVLVCDELAESNAGELTSHFGGLPWLPADAAWPEWDRRESLKSRIARTEKSFQANPRATGLRDMAARMREELSQGPRPLMHLAQLKLSELHASAPLPHWPTDGTLVFFYDESQAWGFDPADRGHCQVLYFSAKTEIRPMQPPASLPESARFPARNISFRREWTLPTRIVNNAIDISIWDNDEYEILCHRLMSQDGDKEPVHRCGGHPQEIQGDMRLECQLVANGLYCGDATGYRDPRANLLSHGESDWQLLFQIDSDEKGPGWMWGDVGRVYFWARKQDIQLADFDRSWAILQCY